MNSGEIEAVRQQLLESRPIAVDFFSGIGGLSLGLELAGFTSGLHIEVDEHATKYAEYNFPPAATAVAAEHVDREHPLQQIRPRVATSSATG